MVIYIKSAYKNLLQIYAAALAAAVFFSCATLPPTRGSADFSVLLSAAEFPAGADVYVLAQTAALTPFVTPLLKRYRMDNKTVQGIVQKTQNVSAALFLDNKEEPAYATLHGKGYPAGGAALFFGTNKDWNKERSGKNSFWYSPRFRIALNMSSKKIHLARRNPYPQGRAKETPAPLPAWTEGAALCAWSPRAAVVNNYLKQQKVFIVFPARAVYLALFPSAEGAPAAPQQQPAAEGGLWELVVCVEAENAARALAVQSLVRLAKSALEDGTLSRRRIPDIVQILLRAESTTQGASVFMRALVSNADINKALTFKY